MIVHTVSAGTSSRFVSSRQLRDVPCMLYRMSWFEVVQKTEANNKQRKKSKFHYSFDVYEDNVHVFPFDRMKIR